jgi:hypothetical protein
MKTHAHHLTDHNTLAKAGKPAAAKTTRGRRRSRPEVAAHSAPARAERAKPIALLLQEFPAPETERVSVGIYCPGANEVFIAGSFNGWQPSASALQAQGDGRWAVDLTLARGRYEYRFVVDGQWMDDPLALAYVSNPFGGLNGVLAVGDRPETQPRPARQSHA